MKGKRLVIVDDVTTTGSTAETLAAVLKHAGAEEVFVLTYASVSRADKNKEEKVSEELEADLSIEGENP